MDNGSENSNREGRSAPEIDRIEGVKECGENGDSGLYYVGRSGTLYPADCLSRAAASRAEVAWKRGEVVTVRRSDGTQTTATLGRSGLGLSGTIIVCPKGKRGGLGLRHPSVEKVEVGNQAIYDSKGHERDGE